MAPRFIAASTALLVMLSAGCGESGSNPRSGRAKDKNLMVKVEPMTLPKVLPQRACFVGIHSYDVMLFGVQLPEMYSCSRVADEVFFGAEQLPWSRDEYQNPDQVEECELERGGGRLQVWRGDPDREGPRFDNAYELSRRACERLETAGWKVIFQEK